MTRDTWQTIADIIVIAISLWFLFSGDFDDIPARRVVSAVALFVIVTSAWRILRRWRARS